ncbi:hypothetical protein ASG17_06115 [Brevundimonas sp. Leaf363]|uniref:hypothetical protein n=1 Tax=Brevundimonas sp. Leaf363 TaxID=1736353 RepID=UPI000700BB8C|nr:hypothetical protein [Brevundimonas sp. Leaf363]KQS55640.1 hypothetical protein ASG17_06115 [Brevundimonas sp. Leaf363]
MSAFEFFFSFYGLLLGLSVAELVGGFARVLHEKARVRFGWLTPLLAVFVALDVATFWNQAWGIFRGAPFNQALLIIGLVIAGVFYIAASVTFPRVSAEGSEQRIDLDDHFWAHRRLVFGCILAANLIVGVMFMALMSVDAGFAAMSTPRLWIGFGVFFFGTATAAFSPWRWAVKGALFVLFAYSLFNVGRAAIALVAAGGWSPATGA